MALIDTTVTTSATTGTTAQVAAAQKTIAASVISSGGKTGSNLSTTLQSIGKATVAKAETVALAAGASALRSAITSLTGVFGGKTTLASGISGSLSGIFDNTNQPNASTATRLISDPLTSTLLSSTPTPTSSAFKVDSLASGSQSVGISGTSSTTGTLGTAMTGTQISTLLGRTDLDSLSAAFSATANKLASSQINGLFGTLAKDSGGSVYNLVGGGALGSSLSRIAASSVSAVGQAISISATGQNVRPVVNNPSNDLNSYITAAGLVTSALPATTTINPLSYYPSTTSNTLIDSSGAVINTGNSNIDSMTANAIVNILQQAGCEPSVSEYSSANLQSGLFGLGLSLAAANGMSALISDLLGCGHSSTPYGQQTLGQTFTATVGSDINIAAQLLPSITNPSTLSGSDISLLAVTNSNLTKSDVPTVNGVLSVFGTNSQSAFTIPTASSSSYPVYDAAILDQAQPDFVNGVFGDSVFSNLSTATPLTLSNTTGQLELT